MARINIEDCWWTDPRRSALARKLGDVGVADGRAAAAWRVAQEFWKKGRVPIPRKLFFALQDAQALIDVDLAEDQGEGGIYVRGSSAYLDWVFESKESRRVGGVKSAEVRKAKYGSAQPPGGRQARKTFKKIEQPSKRNRTESNSIEVSASSSASSSVSVSVSEDFKIPLRGSEAALAQPDEQGVAVQEPPSGQQIDLPVSKKSRYSPETRAKMQAFIAKYSEAYREKYGGPPEGMRDPVLVGKLGNWIAHTSQERAVNLVQVYLQISHRQIDDACHDLWGFFRHLNRIGNALSTGQDPSQINWVKIFGSAA